VLRLSKLGEDHTRLLLLDRTLLAREEGRSREEEEEEDRRSIKEEFSEQSIMKMEDPW